MSNVTFDLQWKEAVMELLDHLETETADEDESDAKGMAEWACVYIKYLQTYKKLEEAYDQVVHPQKRVFIRRATIACVGRMLEVWHWLVKLNGGNDNIQLDEYLNGLKLSPDALEVPVPRFYVDDRSTELRKREEFLDVHMTKYDLQRPSIEPEIKPPPPLHEDDAILIIQANERGRQGRVRAAMLADNKIQQQYEAKLRRQQREPMTPEHAATLINSAVRSFLVRRAVALESEDELEFLGMAPPKRGVDRRFPQMKGATKAGAESGAVGDGSASTGASAAGDAGVLGGDSSDASAAGQSAENSHPENTQPREYVDPQVRLRETLARRKVIQKRNQEEYDTALVELRNKVRETEGPDMREELQQSINQWFISERMKSATGDYPDLPDEEDGGSKKILSLAGDPDAEDEEAAAAEAAAVAAEAAAAKGKGGKAAEAEAEGEGEEVKEETMSMVFVPLIEEAMQEYANVWQDTDEGENFEQKHDPSLIKDALRPLVYEEVRLEVDSEMRDLLKNLKDMVAAERAARSGKKGKKAKGKKGKGKKGKKGKGKDKKKKGKDMTSDRSMESLFAELISNGISLPAVKVSVDDFIGSYNIIGSVIESSSAATSLSPSGASLTPSLAQVRQLAVKYCAMPVGLPEGIHEKLYTEKAIKSVLLYGCEGTGKTMLVHGIARDTGSVLIDLSPRVTDGKYSGSAQCKLMVHIAFKVAKTLAPAIIYIDEIEKVFVSDKKKAKEYGGKEAFSRIKKFLLAEMKALKPGTRVIVMGTSSRPYDCVKKDENAFMNFFDKYIHVPLPDYGALRELWPGLVKRQGAHFDSKFNLSSLVQLSSGYTPGTINKVVRTILTPRRLQLLLEKQKQLTLAEIVRVLGKFEPQSKEEYEQLTLWTKKLPQNRAPSDESTEDKSDKKDKGGKKKK